MDRPGGCYIPRHLIRFCPASHALQHLSPGIRDTQLERLVTRIGPPV
jgi:hypothetical protein